MKRLLNPKNLGLDLLNLPVIQWIDKDKYRVLTKVYMHLDSGSCQCNKDCNCSENRGKVKTVEKTYYRNVKFDNTDKCFYSEPYTREVYEDYNTPKINYEHLKKITTPN